MPSIHLKDCFSTHRVGVKCQEATFYAAISSGWHTVKGPIFALIINLNKLPNIYPSEYDTSKWQCPITQSPLTYTQLTLLGIFFTCIWQTWPFQKRLVNSINSRSLYWMSHSPIHPSSRLDTLLPNLIKSQPQVYPPNFQLQAKWDSARNSLRKRSSMAIHMYIL